MDLGVPSFARPSSHALPADASTPLPSRNSDRAGVVFVSYNGLLDPLAPSQILAYMERIRDDRPVHILSYERADKLACPGALEALQQRLQERQIRWTWLRYHQRPSVPAKIWDVTAGASALRRILRRERIGLVHARGYVPMEIASRGAGDCPILFDIRGLQAEESVDGGTWRQGGAKWRLAKHAERGFFRRAAGAVVLTHAIRPYVRDRFAETGRFPPLEVIPCCVDLKRFRFDAIARERVRRQWSVEDDTVVFLYSGSLGTWYLPKEMAAFVQRFHGQTGQKICLVWMVNSGQDEARATSENAGLLPSQFRILQAASSEIPAYLSAADVGLALIRPSFSKRASSPTKYAEYLAVGLPIVLHAGVGDGQVLVDEGVAVTPEDLAASIAQLQRLRQQPRPSFRAVAERLFPIDHVALPAYRRLYARLMNE